MKPSDLPYVTLKWAQSIDGQLADDDGCSQWISGEEERKYTHLLRSSQDAVMVGARTFLKDRCQLTVRSVPHPGPQPARVIADPRGRLLGCFLSGSDPFEDDHSLLLRRTYVLGPAAPSLRRTPPEVIWVQCPVSERNEADEKALENWLAPALARLSRAFEIHEGRKLRRLMVEGGATLLAALLNAELGDRAEIAVSPVLLGGRKNRVFTHSRLASAGRWMPEPSRKLGNDVLLTYTLNKETS